MNDVLEILSSSILYFYKSIIHDILGTQSVVIQQMRIIICESESDRRHIDDMSTLKLNIFRL